MTQQPVLAGRGLSWRAGEKLALDAVDLDLHAGELLAVCGENGAGKSTLLKIMVGLMAPHAGTLHWQGERVVWPSPAAARAHGVAMVEQHLALALELDAIENTALLGRGWMQIARSRVRAQLQASAARLGLEVPLEVPVGELPLGMRQKIELLRALWGQAPRVLVLDEPTAVLLPHEAEAMYGILRTLANEGVSVVVVTHRLGEVAAHADRVVVLTRGKKVHDAPFDRALDPQRALEPIAKVVFADRAPVEASTERAELGEERLRVRALRAGRLAGVSFTLRAGEVIGLAGSEGNGQEELFEILTAQRAPEAGEVSATSAAFVVADRHEQGLLLEASIADNAVLGDHRALGFVLTRERVEEQARRRLQAILPDVALGAPAGSLSGGNQQKIVVARALERAKQAPFVFLREPTRGVDAGAQREIHQALRALAARGVGILVQSSDLDELRALCTSLFVLERGTLAGPFAPDVADATLAEAMLGAPRAEGAS